MTYDDWKTSSPPEYEREHCDCGEPDCEACAAADAYDRHIDQQIDEEMERR